MGRGSIASLGTVIAVTMTLVAAPALADHHDLVTGSVGTSFGVGSYHQIDNSQQTEFISEFNVRGRFGRIVGLEMAYNPAGHGVNSSQLVFHSSFRLAGQIFFVPLEEVGVYLTMGVGANNFGELFSIASSSNSYHGGLGVEVYVWDNLAVGAEWLMLVPGIRSIQKTVVTHALNAAIGDEQSQAQAVNVESLSPWDFVHPRNFQIAIGARYYF